MVELLALLPILVPALVVLIIIIFLLKSSIVIARGKEYIYLERKYYGKTMTDGRTVALKGEVGVQARILGPGTHFLMPFLYRNWKEPFLTIGKGKMGIVHARTGVPMPSGQIIAKDIDCKLFQDGELFLTASGEKGPQRKILPEGEYMINRYLFDVEIIDCINVQDDEVGLVESLTGKTVSRPGGNFGKPVDCDDFQDANAFLEGNGEKGPQISFLTPGTYRINKYLFHVERKKITNIAGGQIGLVEAADGATIPQGRLLGKKTEGHNSFNDGQAFIEKGGEKGRQLEVLMPGQYRINTNLFKIIDVVPWTEVTADEVGIVTVKEGKPIMEKEKIAAKELELIKHNNFQDAPLFIAEGGEKGLQIPVLRAGNYAINPWFASIAKVPMTAIDIGFCGVVTSFVGEDGEDQTDEKVNAKIVQNGYKGIWQDPLQPGKHPVNTEICKVDIVPTTQILLNWADNESSAHALDDNLKTITLRTADAFNVNMDVSVIIHIPMANAPKVIANLGSVKNMISQVLEPAISSHFRNAAQYIKALNLYTERKELQATAKTHIDNVLKEHHIDSKDTLIADVVLPAELTKTVTDRQIAEETKKTYEMKKTAELTRKDLENATADADMQKEVVKSARNIDIEKNNAEAVIKKAEGQKRSTVLTAEGSKDAAILEADGKSQAIEKMATANASQISQEGTAKADIILAEGQSRAASYQLEVDAMGADNFGRIKVLEQFLNSGIKVIPDNLVIGGGGENGGAGLLESYLGLGLMEKFTNMKLPLSKVDDVTTKVDTEAIIKKKDENTKKRTEESKTRNEKTKEEHKNTRKASDDLSKRDDKKDEDKDDNK